MSDSTPDLIQIVTTTPDEESAQCIARSLVERRLAACVQISGPIESIYRWQGQVETAQEWRCTIKTSGERFEAVASAIRELHSYEVPEILATPIVTGDPDYVRWLLESVDDRSQA